MSNGSNDFGVSYAQISFVDRMLAAHPNLVEVTRSNDIQFDIVRERVEPIRLVCLNEYACGLARVFEAQAVFPGVNLIMSAAFGTATPGMRSGTARTRR
jgi:hypothetical protein